MVEYNVMIHKDKSVGEALVVKGHALPRVGDVFQMYGTHYKVLMVRHDKVDGKMEVQSSILVEEK